MKLATITIEYQVSGDRYLVVVSKHNYEIVKPGAIVFPVTLAVLKGALSAVREYCATKRNARKMAVREGGVLALVKAIAQEQGMALTPMQELEVKIGILG